LAEGTPAPVGRVGFLAPGLALAPFFFLAFLAVFLGFLSLDLCLLLAGFGLRDVLFCLVPFPGVGVPEDVVLEVVDEEVDDDDDDNGEVELEVELEEEGVLVELEVEVVLESEDELYGVVELELSGHDSDPLTIVAPAGSESWSSGVP
jgi:hypothetical protein